LASLESMLAWRRANGFLREFNSRFRRERLAAAERGERFMSTARRRRGCSAFLMRIAATGMAPAAIVKTVFEDILLLAVPGRRRG
jgi:hypothetical protein